MAMKKVDIGQVIAVTANMGVIAGIVFLALELQQNNRFLSAQAQFNILQNRSVGTSALAESPESAEFWAKVNRGEELNDSESLRVQAYAIRAILNWEWEYGQYQEGNIGRDKLPLTAWRTAFRGKDPLRQIDVFPDVWDRLRDGLNPDFVLEMEKEITR
jgi:hypothetical protein